MRQQTKHLAELIGSMQSGNQVYERLQQKIGNGELGALIEGNLERRRQALQKLESSATSAAAEASLDSQLDEEIADMRAMYETNSQDAYLKELEHIERKNLEQTRFALSRSDSGREGDMLRDLQAWLEETHDRILSAREASRSREHPQTLATRIVRQ